MRNPIGSWFLGDGQLKTHSFSLKTRIEKLEKILVSVGTYSGISLESLKGKFLATSTRIKNKKEAVEVVISGTSKVLSAKYVVNPKLGSSNSLVAASGDDENDSIK